MSAAASSQPSITVAVVSALGALLVAIVSAVFSGVTARSQMVLKNRLDQQAKAEDARQAYEYDARKRLYQECEPLLFQARELANEARGRITGLAIAARKDQIREDGAGWLAEPGYYTLSTCYNLVAPATIYLLLQRRLTDFDLGLEPRIQAQYEILKLLYASVSDDFRLAEAIRQVYRPDDADPGKPNREKLRTEQPAIYRRQGLYRGTMSRIGDAFLTKKGPVRCKTFAEFSVEGQDNESLIGRVLPDLLDLVQGFHPVQRPVLWLVLLEQLMLYDLLRQCSKLQPGDEVTALKPPSAEDYVTDLHWHTEQEGETAENARDNLATLTCVRDRVVNLMRERLTDFTGPQRS